MGPNQKMVTDITYVSDGKQFYSLSVIQDLFNHEIVAWQMSKSNAIELVLNTVSEWTKKKDVGEPCNIRIKAFSIRPRPTTIG
ncbi:hypothetical protein J7E71_18450 [Mesobacillus foraminis]|uniref:DDE-type integrase/transposase/recombinase n=1 Tax=Mesobacillus foraminis TaxID=279826 RepID=UPI001BE935DA|nr:DDE-type integrase/transposase/recombinase [Mesobacillus foraminis]MBT2757869.1 hypothetical protein [Mesobacillus foraminis]